MFACAFCSAYSASGSSSSKASGGESSFVGSEVYVNRIPDPPCEGKMLRLGQETLDLVEYKPTVLEARYRFPLLDDSADFGLNFDIVDVTSFESPWARLEYEIPASKRKKHSDTDSSHNASSTSYYQHYQKKHKNDIAANTIMASKHGRVAAADLVLSFDQQLRSIPKAQQAPLFHRDSVAKVTTATSVPSTASVTWLKRTEYMTSRDERSLALTSARVSETLAQLDALERESSGHLNMSGDSSSTTAGNGMDIDDEFLPQSQAANDTRDAADRLVDEILTSQPQASQSARSPGKKSPSAAAAALPADVAESPFKKDPTRVLRSIEASFDAIASRTAIVHPSEAANANTSSSNIRRSSSVGLTSSSSNLSGGAPHIVEEWDIFPNDLIWENSYLLVQSDVQLPKGDLVMLPSFTHTPTLLKPSHTQAEFEEVHLKHLVPQRRPELLSLYAKPSLNPGKTIAGDGTGDAEGGIKCASDEVAFSAHWEAEATSLQPTFESIGTFVFNLGETAPYDGDEDEESGISYEGETSAETAAARTRKNNALKKAKVGKASFKNFDSRVQMRPPLAEARQLAQKQGAPTQVLKLVPSAVPDLEMHLRETRASALRE